MKTLKSLNPKNTPLIHRGATKALKPTIPTDAQANAFVGFANLKPENFMKQSFLALISVVTFNLALADENAPVNFRSDQRAGQVNTNIKMSMHGSVTQFDQKICFVTGGLRDQKIGGKFEPGCTGKKLTDTLDTLEYQVICTGHSDLDMKWQRISDHEISYVAKSRDLEIASTIKYMGETCDADAVKK